MSRRSKVKPIAAKYARPVAESELLHLIDDSEWRRVGDELRRVDPTRYLELLRVGREIVEIHRDPLVRFEGN